MKNVWISRSIALLLLIVGVGASAQQSSSTSATLNSAPNPQGLFFNKVNGFTPIVNGFPVTVGEVYLPNTTGSNVNQILYSLANNPYPVAMYLVLCGVGASATSAGVTTLSLSYTDAITGHLFSYSMGTITLSTTAPTIVPPVFIGASNATSITITNVLVSGTATFTIDCYIHAENHH
jgi:hypothetical protein